MLSIFRKRRNRLDLSSPSSFEKSIIKNSDSQEELFDQKTFEELVKKPNPRAYGEILESLALSGNVKCQEFVAQWSIIMINESSDNPEWLKYCLRKAIQFGQLAVQSGVTGEAVNLPISMMKLAHILIEESGGYSTEEIDDLFKGAYYWHVMNSKNLQLSKTDRRSAAEWAVRLYEASPELYDSGP